MRVAPCAPCAAVPARVCAAPRGRRAAPLRARCRSAARTWRCASGGGSGEDADDDAPTLPADWRDFRARLVASELSEEGDAPAAEGAAAARWAHAVVAPETGCILLANPALFTASQPYFRRAAIFLFEHSDEGSAGLILNRPTEHTLGSIAGATPFLPEFALSPLYMGGDVGKSSLHLLHADNPAALPSGRTVVRGIGIGGFDGAVAAVRSGAMRTADFRFFTRYCGWGPGQLAEEVAQGVWFLAAASADVVLALPRDAPLRAGGELRGPASGADRRDGGLWADVLRLMGGEYAAMAQAALDAEA